MRRILLSTLAAAALLARAASATATPADAAATPLTNLAHLDALTTTVRPPAAAGHTTYRLADAPAVGVLWVYADHQPDGSYRPVGGGSYDPATNTYGQGAYDADDISRAAVVYLRHWRQFGDAHSRRQAYALLRGLTYLQTVGGTDAGNVVLWMQPDGTLNPSPTPKDNPDPSDSGASFWLARTIWALSEGYAAFRRADPGFAGFLRDRLNLAVAALDREVLVHYGRYQVVDGVRMPAWLIADGADASSEAVLGLTAYVRAGGGPAARSALAELASGIAAMGLGSARQWPYGAVLPSATSISMWHAWAAQMPSALAGAAAVLHRPQLLRAAVADAAVFTPHLLTATGPDNGWLPAPVDGTQIAYGADARVQALLAVADATGRRGLRRLAGFAAGWFFGQNPAGIATYDPATGVTHDGVSADGTVNLNSGAESTIHGLLTMEALDAHPGLIALARAAGPVVLRAGPRTVEAEAATLSGPAEVVAPGSAWTGESQWSGGGYVQAAAGATLRWSVPAADQPRLLQAVVNRVPGAGAIICFAAGGHRLGAVQLGGGGAQGVSAAPGALLPVTVAVPVPAGATSVTARVTRGSGQLDAIQLTPLLSRVVTSGGAALVSSVAATPRRITLAGPSTATSYDDRGRAVATSAGAGAVTITVPAGGFALATG